MPTGERGTLSPDALPVRQASHALLRLSFSRPATRTSGRTVNRIGVPSSFAGRVSMAMLEPNGVVSPTGSAMSDQHPAARFAVLLGVIIIRLDISLASTALPTVARNINADAACSIWIVNTYYLAVIAALLPRCCSRRDLQVSSRLTARPYDDCYWCSSCGVSRGCSWSGRCG